MTDEADGTREETALRMALSVVRRADTDSPDLRSPGMIDALLGELSAPELERLAVAAGVLCRRAWEEYRAKRGARTTGQAAPDGVSSVTKTQS